MRIVLLFGFLGSGKTTLASRILRQEGGRRRLALIVNEFGEVGVDGQILRGNSIDMVELSSGCLCCTLKGSLLNAIEELAQRSADYIVVEATGVASPEEMLDSLSDLSLAGGVQIGPITTVVDTAKFLKIRSLVGPFYESQIANCDLVLLNKIDLCDSATVDRVNQAIREINPEAAVRLAEQADIELTEILDGPVSGLAEASAQESDHHHHEHTHAPAKSFVCDVAPDIGEPELRRLMSNLPERVWRAKGFVRMQGRDYLVQYTMGQLEISDSAPRGRWYMVFIGDDMDEAAIRSQIERLGTRKEVA